MGLFGRRAQRLHGGPSKVAVMDAESAEAALRLSVQGRNPKIEEQPKAVVGPVDEPASVDPSEEDEPAVANPSEAESVRDLRLLGGFPTTVQMSSGAPAAIGTMPEYRIVLDLREPTVPSIEVHADGVGLGALSPTTTGYHARLIADSGETTFIVAGGVTEDGSTQVVLPHVWALRTFLRPRSEVPRAEHDAAQQADSRGEPRESAT